MTSEPDLLPQKDVTKLRRQLRRWHRQHGRDLPWRQAGDAYRVWISEIMLQQTTVAAVVPYYERFLKRFPNVTALARADEADVLRLWEGLGYYSRARNIYKTARTIINDHGGRFPERVDELLRLPGIGRYTAGAIASFAFDRAAPIVEANTLRLYSRLLGFDGDPRSTNGQRLLWSFAEQLLPRTHPGEFNQALMDLGATVCTVNDPDCPQCPLRTVCLAFRANRVDEIPRPKRRVAVTEVVEATVAVRKRGDYLLRQRGDDERWAGLWDFLRFDVPDIDPSADQLPGHVRRQLVERIEQVAGIKIDLPSAAVLLRHSVTRYRITLHCQTAEYRSGRLHRGGQPLAWVRPSAFDQYALSVTARQFAQILAGKSRNS